MPTAHCPLAPRTVSVALIAVSHLPLVASVAEGRRDPDIVIVRQWEGLSQAGIYQADWSFDVPADPVIAFARVPGEAPEGPGFVATMVNRTIKIFNEDGSEALDGNSNPMQADLDDFFGFTGNRFDPRLFFDRHEGRFVACALGSSAGTGLQLKVRWSQLVTTQGFPDLAGWGGPQTALGTDWGTLGNWNDTCGAFDTAPISIDQPSLGYDDKAWYASSFKFPQFNIQPFDEISLNVFHTFAKLGASNPRYTFSNNWSPEWCHTVDDLWGAETTRAVEHFDQPLADSGDPSPFFVGIIRKHAPGACTGIDDPPHNMLRIVSIEDPLGVTPTLHEVQIPTAECFKGVDYFEIPTDAGVWDGKFADPRIANACYREDGENRYLYCVHAVERTTAVGGQSEAPQVVIRWYKIDMKDWPGGNDDPEIVSWGQIDGGIHNGGTPINPADDAAVHLFHPAIAANANHDIAIVMAQSSGNETISMRAWGRLADGTVMGPETIIASAVGTVLDQPQGDREFGDYFDIALDDDDLRFWVIGEYIKEGEGEDPDYWATRIALIELTDD